MNLWQKFFGKKPDEAGEQLYGCVVSQARNPGFYLDQGVPDTVDGRFDMIALHAFVVMRRLGGAGEENARLAQAMFDAMFADMDRNLREMGTGDLSVGRKVKELVAVFYGRIKAYEAGLEEGKEELAQALRRNLYRKSTPGGEQVAQMASYLKREVENSQSWEPDKLIKGELNFGPPPGSPA